jgi:hypothetical protein
MGIASVVLAVLTVSFLCVPWIEPLVTLVRRRRRLRLPRPRPPAATGSPPADDGAAAVAMPKTKSKLRDEEEVEDIVKDEKDDVQSAAVRSRITYKLEKGNPPTTTTADNDAYKDNDDDNDDNDDDDNNDADDALPSVSDPRQWQSLNRCFCEEGGGLAASFLPPGLLQDQFKSAGALLQLGAGGCYHMATDKKRR